MQDASVDCVTEVVPVSMRCKHGADIVDAEDTVDVAHHRWWHAQVGVYLLDEGGRVGALVVRHTLLIVGIERLSDFKGLLRALCRDQDLLQLV